MKTIIRTELLRFVSAVSPKMLAAWRVAQELRMGEPELALLSLLSDRTRDFIDIGANTGVYAFHARRYFRRVVAVEAHPELIAPLRRILGARGDVHACALSDHQGLSKLWVPQLNQRAVTTRSSLERSANPGFELREVTVNVTSLDALEFEAPAVVKIDVEGHEFSVLSGAVETLKRHKPVCIVEIEERHNEGGVSRALSLFEGLGYRAWYLHRGALCDGADFDAERLQAADQAKSVDGGRSADYINNFLFFHPDNASGLERIRTALQ
jgi:FkbM family methyltransferase